MRLQSSVVVHQIPDGGVAQLPITKAAIKGVSISGTDMVLTLADGSQHLLRDFALKVALQPQLQLNLGGQVLSGKDLMKLVGKVDLSEATARVVQSPGSSDDAPAPAPDAKKKASATDAEAADPKAASPDPADATPKPSQPPAPEGIAKAELTSPGGKDADFRNETPTTLAPPPMVQGSPSAPSGNNNPPPPPPPPPDTIGIKAVWTNVAGQTTSQADGKAVITGAGGSPRSGTDPTPSIQGEREQILGTTADDRIIGDGASALGQGWARVITINLSGRLDLTVKSVEITGLPDNFTVTGATPSAGGWRLDLPADLAANGNRLQVTVQYPIAADGSPFSPSTFDITLKATGTMDGKDIEGSRIIPATLRDVQEPGDMAYSAGGKEGVVFPAFGLGDEILAGGGNDEVLAGFGHDIVWGQAGDDTLKGEAGNDTLIGGAGADALDGGSGRDAASYLNSAEGVHIDLAQALAEGGDAQGDKLVDVENLIGSTQQDELRGDANANRLEGGDGDDTVEGRAGADTLVGGEGFDTAEYVSSTTGVNINLAASTGSGGDAEGDSLVEIEAVVGSEFNDKLVGDAVANQLSGQGGNDTLDGGAGADTLKGGAGSDTASYAASTVAVNVSLATGQGAGGDADGDRLEDIENLIGSKHADELSGNDEANQLDGGAGDDWLEGNGGADTLIGGSGTDTASYLEATAAVVANLGDPSRNTGDAQGDSYTSIENLEGSEYDDILIGDAGNNILMGVPGNDQLFGADGADTLVGGAGRDTLDGGAGVDTASYSGSNEAVTVDLSAGLGAGGDADGDQFSTIENVVGSRYGDRLIGNAEANLLNGGRGADTLTGGAGADTLMGGDGSDMADYSTSTTGVVINLSTGQTEGGDAAGDVFEFIENLSGSQGHDALTGDSSANTLLGNEGDDSLVGAGGNDRLDGGEGDDALDGGTGADTLTGGAGVDTVSYAASAAAVQVNLSTGVGKGGDAEGDRLQGIENLLGTDANDNFTGNADANRLDGGKGDDTLEGGQGADTLVGGVGRDTASYAGAQASVTAHLKQAQLNSGEASGDSYSEIENLLGSQYADTLSGNDDDNLLSGAAGDDRLAGGLGADTLAGGEGGDTASYASSTQAVTVDLQDNTGSGGEAEGDSYDSIEHLEGSVGSDKLAGDSNANRLSGGEGNDTLEGRAGADTLDGGSGEDTASYASAASGVVANLTQASLNSGDAAGDQYTSIEHLRGSQFADSLTGDTNANMLDGGLGDDVLEGGQGADTLVGGAGNDTASYSLAQSAVLADLANAASNSGDAAGDVYTDIENLSGSAHDDQLRGNEQANRLRGDAGNDTLVGGLGADTLEGGSGNDTVSYASSAAGVSVDLAAGSALGGEAQGDQLTGIENLLGSNQQDSLVGNAVANRLEGGDGHDSLDGGLGADTLLGGQGDDLYSVDNELDSVQELAGAGTDTVKASISYALTAQVENLQLLGSENLNATGNVLANVLTGNDGANLMDGGLGADTLAGGLGDDTYMVDNAGDQVSENAAEGIDKVIASISYRLGSEVEHLTLTGTDALNGTGNELANRIEGNGGSNVLDGGSGTDTLVGGQGDDSYVVDHINDVVIELNGQGQDRVRASVSTTLSANVEELELTGTAHINATGNTAANLLTGNSGNNVLDGGAGVDTLRGGAGNDSYVVDNAADVVEEAAGEGVDQVLSSVSYALGANLENLTLTGSADIDGSGNTEDNTLIGNEGANRLNGQAGADLMAGGAGDDTYLVDNANDVVQEEAGNGRDSAQASLSYTLTDNVEDLLLLGSSSIDGTGNAAANQITGNAGNNRLDGGAGADTLIGGSGDDTYTVDNLGDRVIEGSGDGTDTVRSSITWALGANLENLTLTGRSAIHATGNELDNSLIGNAGANFIDGGRGADLMMGGGGDDTYWVDNAADVVQEASGEGNDTIVSSLSLTLGEHIDNLTLTGTAHLSGTGNTLANVLSGNEGNNTLDGKEGGDTLQGGLGNDSYVVDSLDDVVIEELNAGVDVVQASVSTALSDNVEQLRLTGAEAIDGTGNSLDNLILGNSADNTLDGGSGNDTLEGGAGNDTYVIDSLDDVVTELTNKGNDTIRSTLSTSLGANLENLTLLGNANLNATGNELANVLLGNTGNNRLDGGLGADSMNGGAGNDLYIVDDSGDTVTEGLDQGDDTVQAGVSFTLGTNIERLTLTGTDALNGTGNALDNVLTGNRGANTLDGGSGADSMAGGAGDDSYVVDNIGDVVTENPGDGNDTVRSSVSWALGATLENLTLTGSDAINATGNSLANVLTGNAGNNLISGGGGADTLYGGGGDDTLAPGDNNFALADGGSGFDSVQADALGVANLSSLASRLSAIEQIDLRGSTATTFSIAGADLNTAGLLGADANNRLEVLTDNVSGARDVVLLSEAEFANVSNMRNAADVVLSTGSAGKLFTAISVGQAGVAVDANALVLPELDELASTWGRIVDPLTGMAGLATWVDATDLNGDGLAQGAVETDGLRAGGSTLATWSDKSGQGNHMVSAAAASSPTLTANGINGLSTIRFDGNDGLTSAISYGNTYTVFAVGTMAGTQNGRLLNSSTANFLMGWWGGKQDQYFADNWVTNPNTSVVANQTKLYAAVANANSAALYSNGVQVPSTGTTYVGAMGKLSLGGVGLYNELSKGDLGEVMVFTRALTDTERQAVEAYLRGKWTTQSNSVAPLGTIGFDDTWTNAKVLFGSTAADTLSASYDLAAARGTGRMDAVLFGGAGNDTLTGGARVDALYGAEGNDSLDGGAGADWMVGGNGNDSYVVDSVGDSVVELAGGGTDTVNSSVSLRLQLNLENLVLAGTTNLSGWGNNLNNIVTGNSGANDLTGQEGNDTLIGQAGNDTLRGGIGADSMVGGTGDDSYYVDDAGDVIVEDASAGTDYVFTSVAMTLPANVELVQITGTANISVTGTSGNDDLRFSTEGGTQTLIGTAGNDIYRLYDYSNGSLNTANQVIEQAGEGTDTLWVQRNSAATAVTVTLPNNVESLDLSNTWGVSGVGTAGADTLQGTARYGGYSGNATSLSGLDGNDTYIVYTVYTSVIETATGGTDAIDARGFDYRLPSHVENLRGNVFGGNINLFGNELNNNILANGDSNLIDGGAGADTLDGGAGDDTYLVDNAADSITDASGTDTVRTSLGSYTLGSSLERLAFTGTGSNTGVGNASNNVLIGNVGNDNLDGSTGDDTLVGGHGGADTLQGGLGNDVLVSTAAQAATGVQSGLRAQYFNNQSWYGTPVLTRQDATVNFDWGTGSPAPGVVNADNFSTRWTGNLTLSASEAGTYTFRGMADDWITVWIDGQMVLHNGGTWNNQVTSLPLVLSAGVHSIRIDTNEGSGGATAQLSWAKQGASSYSAIPSANLSSGTAVSLDTQGDSLVGGAGNDTLQGADANDTLVGGTGDDTYIVSGGSDIITELAGEGIDTLQTSATADLSGTQLENVNLMGSGNVNATGNTLANVLIGNSGNNLLSGGDGDDTLQGNSGADTLQGGVGNDSLMADGGSSLDGGDGNDTLTLATLWSPKALGNGLALWLDAADVDGDGSREGMAESGLNAGALTTWIDKSGNGRHAMVTEAFQQPQVVQGGMNGLATVRFDGVNDGMTLSGLPTLNGNTNSLFWVQRTSDTNYMPLTSNNGINGWFLIGAINEGSTDLAGSGNLYSTSALYKNGALANWTTRGSVYTGLNGSTHTVAIVNQPLGFNGGLTLANGYNAGGQVWNFAGDESEIIVTTNTLDLTTRQVMEGYLAWKWGTQALLPADHPYKTSAPLLYASTGGSLQGGAGNDTLTGGNANDTLDGGIGADRLAGGQGDDRYLVDDAGDVVVEAAGAGLDTVLTGLSTTLAAEVENLTLTGSSAIDGTGNSLDNQLTGNSANNTLSGLAGNDTLDGGAGADTLAGGTGNDTYIVDTLTDQIIEAAGEGTDTVQANVSYLLAADLENLQLTGSADLTGTGNAVDNQLTGNSGANLLSGLDGNDSLNGGTGSDTLDGGAGNDSLVGGAGDDLYLLDAAGDSVVEAVNEGIDIVQASVSVTLGANVENLELQGSANLDGTGNSGDNRLSGNSGDNILSGGSGADTLTGGLGNDTYVVDSALDVIQEAAGQGQDSVLSSVAWVLADGLENLTLTGSANIDGSGNAAANVLLGNSGANALSGGAGDDQLDGAAGADTLAGGSGDDSYSVDNAGDVITESAGDGNDSVSASVSYTLSAHVEQLSLLGSADLNATGNDLNNRLQGNAGHNRLDGGSGQDTLVGGAGDDTYVVDNTGDVVQELADQGQDSVLASVTYTLSDNVEDLTLQGAAAIDGTGNAAANVLTGNAANNRLSGGDGADTVAGGGGADTLVGGRGDDVYLIDAAGSQIVEASGEGNDSVLSSVSWVLSTNVEHLSLTGANAIDGTGNASANQLLGNAAANRLDGGAGADTLSGGAGDDTYVVDNLGDVVQEAASQGQDTVIASISLSLADNLENLSLSGSANLTATGNAAANVLTGNAGNNTLDGQAGADTLIGGAGNDVYVVDNVGDVVTEAAAQGTDTVQASVSYSLATNVENLTLTGTAAVNATGNTQANVLVGNQAANVLDGGSGSDTLQGGLGDDTYVVDSLSDVITENAGEGTDTVRASVNWTLGTTLEHLVLTGSANLSGTGNGQANQITGNSGANLLSGLAGNDTLSAGAGNDTLDGGSGNDSLVGGAGDDLYVLDAAGDSVVESADEGNDTVQASISHTLAAHVENLQLQGSANLDGTGHSGNNVLTGNRGDNRLDGGTGADTLIGGLGNDTYVVDTALDVVQEQAGEGTDTVQTDISYVLADGLENLSLTGSADLQGGGNASANTLLGNSGANLLQGAAGNDTLNGGAGADTLVGGSGDDSYIIDQADDVIIETSSEGSDSVTASISHRLADNVEHLTLTGSADLSGEGNSLDNVLIGNSGHNTLVGGGGVDTLRGGDGDDSLTLGSAANIGQVDGGSGTDTLTLLAPESDIDLSAWVGQVSNIEQIRLSDGQAGDSLTVDLNALLGLTDANHHLNIELDTGDQFQLLGEHDEGTVSVDANGFMTVLYQVYADPSRSTVASTVEVHYRPEPVPGG